MPTKRQLFTTPTRSVRRRTKAKPRTVTRIPRSMKPETKQYISGANFTNTTNEAYVSVPDAIQQGDNDNQFVGTKLRVLRLRVYYDFSQLSLTDAVRISVIIPKDPTATPSLLYNVDPWPNNAYTVLHDMLLPDDPSVLAGTFDITGPINVQYSSGGITPLKNNIYIYLHSASNGASLANLSAVKYSLWYSDA